LSGIYTDDEMAHDDRPAEAPRRVTAAEIRREKPRVIEGETAEPPPVEDPPAEHDGWPEVATIPGTDAS
jgi:hypothetical protein